MLLSKSGDSDLESAAGGSFSKRIIRGQNAYLILVRTRKLGVSRRHLQGSQTNDNCVSSLDNELGSDNVVQPPDSTFPQRHTDEDKVDKQNEECIDAVFKQ